MSSVTIHDLDSQMYERIKMLAKSQGVSINRIVKNLLEKSLGNKTLQKENDTRSDFMEFCGVWSQEEYEMFSNEIKAFETVDAEDWR